MNVYLAEFVGTTLLVLLGNGVVANVVLRDTKGHEAGWIVITAGWGFAVYTAVLCVGEVSGAHINPAVSIGLAAAGVFEWSLVPGYIAAQMVGGIVGASLVFVFYQPHYARTDDADAKLATFCTAPAIRQMPHNFLCELIATFVLLYAVLLMSDPVVSLTSTQEVSVGLGSIGALRVGLIVFAIGMSLGGTTGYAINPARDLGPRIAHALLPIPGKRDSDWTYAAIPVAGPIAGALLAALLYLSQNNAVSS
jgi:glycerol uptake facilitator protein